MSAAVAMGSPTHPRDARRRAFTARAPALRLTRRGRAVMVICVALVGMLLVLALRQVPSLAGDQLSPAATYDYVVVEPGQTLWQIAEAAAPHADPRVTIMRIQDLNGLPDAAVSAGQRIAVPRSR